MAKTKVYHVSAGNSSKGPIGFCAEIRAKSKAEAIRKLGNIIPDHLELKNYASRLGIEYVTIYFNVDAVTEEDVDEVRDE